MKKKTSENKVAVVTGGSGGIGLEIIKRLNKCGYKTVCVSRTKPADADCDFFMCDLSDAEQTKQTAQQITEKYSEISLVVNNAGLGISGATELLPIEQIRYVMEVDYFAPLIFTRALLPAVVRGGKIVMISSACALFALPYRNVYCSAKAALNMLAYGLRMELSGSGIKVITVCPGDIKSGFTDSRIKNTETNERYGESVIKAQQKVDTREHKRMNVVKAGKKIAKICVRKSRPLYIIGAKYKFFYFCSKIFPQSFMVWIINKIFN